MDTDIDTREPACVELATQSIFNKIFPEADPAIVRHAFDWAVACFNGSFRDYQPIDARYHDLEHTLQGTLCFVRLLYGRHVAGVEPTLNARMFELGLLGILLHDTGYLKKRGDNEGTGAKYTLIHVNRSVDFARALLAEKGYTPDEINAVANMIRCTGVNLDLKSIPFSNELERSVGLCIGTADLLGQMAAKDYVDKLPVLFSEFAESAEYNRSQGSNVGAFGTVRELIEKTPLFWEKYVLPKINGDFGCVYRFLNSPQPDGSNCYLERIEANMTRVRKVLASGAS